MLQHKDINKLSELRNGFTHRWLEPDFIFSSLKCFSFSTLCKGLAPLKIRGYSFELIFSILISLPFKAVSSINGLSSHVEAKKDVFYRLKNNPGICWRYILWLFGCKFRSIAESDDNERIKCLIFDDSVIQKTGKLIEKASYVWDHVQNRCVLGFKLLVMGYWDGTSMIPLDFSLHREEGKNKEKPFGLRKKDFRKQYKKPRKQATHSYDRSKEADESKITSMLKMFGRAISHGFKVDYVLTDSWFTCEALIEAVCKVKKQTVHLIGMYKIAKTKFLYKGQPLTYSQIRNSLGKAKRNRMLKLYYLQAEVEYKGRKLQLFFSKKGKNGKWKVLLTTDTKIGFLRLIEIYQTRWSIEVFFKESKQLLSMGNCQSNDFDAQIADMTISMIQYMMLTLRYRFDTYESKGKLFEQVQSEMLIQRLNERLWVLFIELLQILEILFEDVDEMGVFEKIVTDDKAWERLKALFAYEPALNKSS